MKNMVEKFKGIAFGGIMLYLSSLLKISFVLGSQKFYFSGLNFITSLTSCSWCFVFLFYKVAFYKSITLGLPTFISILTWKFMINFHYRNSMYLEVLNFIFRFILPLFCVFLFILHPVGRGAFIYSFYWFIPVVFYLLQKFKKISFVFVMALTSTFVSHAVGSIIWLYTLNLSCEEWLALIPVVAIERLVFAVGTTLVYLILQNNLNIEMCLKKLKIRTVYSFISGLVRIN